VCSGSETSTAVTCTATGLTTEDNYTFTVAAINSYGTGSFSSTSTSLLIDALPGTPTAPVAEVMSDTSVAVAWAAPSDIGSAIAGYQVNDTNTTTSTTETNVCAGSTTCAVTTCAVTGLTYGDSYSFTVVAINEEGMGAFSPASATFVIANTPTGADEVLGSGNEAELPTHVTASSVDTENGNLSKSYADFSMPGRGIPLSFTRTYNSLNATIPGTDGLGEGWTGTWSDSIAYAPGTDDGVINVTEANGSIVSFTDIDGVWTPPARVFATLSENEFGGYAFTVAGKTVYTFSLPSGDTAGQLAGVSNLAGVADALVYDGLTRPSYVQNEKGANPSIDFGYNAYGELTSITGPDGKKTTYTYSSTTLATANLLTVTDPDGNVTTYTYNESNLLSSITDPEGNVTTFTYSEGLLASQTSPLGGVTSYTYSVNSTGTGTTAQTVPSGAVTTVTYVDGEATSSALSYSGLPTETTSYTYDQNTNGAATVTDPVGNVTNYTYNALGEPLTIENPDGGTTTYTYDALGDPLTVENPDGVTTTNTYNAGGNILTSSTPLTGDTGSSGTAITTYIYDNLGDPLKVENPNGGTTRYYYDGNGNVIASTDPDGNESTYGYNGDNETTSESTPDANGPTNPEQTPQTSYTYDGDGNVLTTRVLEDSRTEVYDVTTNTYDGNGNILTTTDPVGNETSYIYDGDGNLAGTLYADGTSTSATYDTSDNKLSSTDASGNTTTYTYDAYGRMISMTNSLDETTTYGYNDDNVQTTLTDPEARVTTTSYDGDGNVTGVSYSDGTTPDVAYAYNSDDQITSMTDGSGTTDYTYNSFGQQTNASEGGETTTYAHDLDGNTTSVTYPVSSLSAPVTYTYDLANKMTSVTDFFGQTTNFTYSPNGNLTDQSDPDGVTVDSTYDARNNPLAINVISTAGTWDRLYYTYNPDDQVTSEEDSGPGFPADTTEGYTYTPTSQVASVNGDSTSYTSAGSITGLENGTAQTYNTGSELTGSTPSGGSATTYAYNSLGERTGATDPADNTTSFGYNQDGDLTSFSPASDLTSLSSSAYSYYGNGLLASETTGGNTNDFAWNTTGSLPLMLTDGVYAYIYGPSSTPIEQVDLATESALGAGADTFLVMDALGSVREQFDDSGNLLGSVSYDANGNAALTTGTISSSVGYTGAWTDSASGMIYLRARWYDSATAQFVSVDPALTSTLQAYEYAGDNPLNSNDPTGNGNLCDMYHTTKAQQKCMDSINPERTHYKPDTISCGPNFMRTGICPGHPKDDYASGAPAWPMEIIYAAGGIFLCIPGAVACVAGGIIIGTETTASDVQGHCKAKGVAEDVALSVLNIALSKATMGASGAVKFAGGLFGVESSFISACQN
jgi:RHS repeat-associated protein